jgi:hypothetical protein
MNRITTPLLAALLLSGAAASAQTTFRLGLRGGANRASTTVDPAGNSSGNYPFSSSIDKSAIYAWQAGVVLEANFGKLAFQPALLFSQKGEALHTTLFLSGFTGYNSDEVRSTNRYNWLEVPLNVVYTLHGDHGLQVFAGPYVAVAVGGRQRGSTASAYYGPPTYQVPSSATSRDFDERVAYGPDANNRRVDAGLNFGLGYRQGPVQAQFGYALGLLNLHKTTGRDYFPELAATAAYNRGVQLTGTYFFAL